MKRLASWDEFTGKVITKIENCSEDRFSMQITLDSDYLAEVMCLNAYLFPVFWPAYCDLLGGEPIDEETLVGKTILEVIVSESGAHPERNRFYVHFIYAQGGDTWLMAGDDYSPLLLV